MTRRFAALLLSCAALIPAAPASAEGLKTESGRLQSLIATLASSDYVLGEAPRDPRPYVDPAPALNAFRHLASALAWGDVHVAARQAAKLDYEVVEFTDTKTKHEYYVLRENPSGDKAIRGWGSYIVNPQSAIDALVEIPHPIADVQTPETGALVFEESGARGFLLAGAHRTKADVPDLIDSIFHQVHTAWIGPLARVTAWQIHGFDGGKHDFPRGAAVVASTGGGDVAPEIRNLHALMEDRGMTSYVFNDRGADARINQRLNKGVPGVTFSALAATKNEQGRLSRSLGGSFVHVELEAGIRTNADSRALAATVIAAAMARGAEPAADEAAQPEVMLTSLESPPAKSEVDKSPATPADADAPIAEVASQADDDNIPREAKLIDESSEVVSSKLRLPAEAKPLRPKRSRARTS